MSATDTMSPRSFDPDGRRPPQDGEDDAPPALPSFVAELKALPRWKAPKDAGSALTFAAVMERVDESRLDARLESEAPGIRRLLAALRDRTLRAPATLQLPSTGPARLRLLPRTTARLAAFAAAAAAALLLAATFLPSLSGDDYEGHGGRGEVGALGSPRARTGLAAQTAALSSRPTLDVEVRYVERGGR